MNKTISIIWGTEDVQNVRPDLTEEQAYQVLLDVEEHHDANDGINWDFLRYWADYRYPVAGDALNE